MQRTQFDILSRAGRARAFAMSEEEDIDTPGAHRRDGLAAVGGEPVAMAPLRVPEPGNAKRLGAVRFERIRYGHQSQPRAQGRHSATPGSQARRLVQRGGVALGAASMWRPVPILRAALHLLRRFWAELLAVVALAALIIGVNPERLGKV